MKLKSPTHKRKKPSYDWRTSQEWRDGWNDAIEAVNIALEQNLPVKFITKAPPHPKQV